MRYELTGVLVGDFFGFLVDDTFFLVDLVFWYSSSLSFSSSEISGFISYSLELPESEGGDLLTIVIDILSSECTVMRVSGK